MLMAAVKAKLKESDRLMVWRIHPKSRLAIASPKAGHRGAIK
jgi:hypothetical protein